MTKERLLIGGVVLAACLGILLMYNSPGKRSSSRPVVAVKQESNAPAPSQRSTEVRRLDSSVDGHVSSMKENSKKADVARRAFIAARDAGPTSSTEVSEQQIAELEKSMQASLEGLTQQLLNNPELTTQVITLLQEEEDPALMMMIAQALGEAAAMQGDKFPYRLLLDMAENDPSHARRQAALVALASMTVVPGELQLRIAEISRTAPNEVRGYAIMTMGGWMNRNRQLTDKISETLLETREATTDDMTRGLVIQTIGNMDSPLSPKVLEAMTDAVMNEPNWMNRSQAAVALGSGVGPENRDQVIQTLQKAYAAETKLDTKRHIITQITKASKENAEEYLRNLPTPDPLLAQDVKDYMEILATVDRSNWGSIWDAKANRDESRGTYPASHGGHGEEGPDVH